MENSKQLESELGKLIVHPWELIEKIDNGNYVYYKPISLKELENEAKNIGVSPEEFRNLIQKDLRARYDKIEPPKSRLLPERLLRFFNKNSKFFHRLNWRVQFFFQRQTQF